AVQRVLRSVSALAEHPGVGAASQPQPGDTTSLARTVRTNARSLNRRTRTGGGKPNPTASFRTVCDSRPVVRIARLAQRACALSARSVLSALRHTGTRESGARVAKPVEHPPPCQL